MAPSRRFLAASLVLALLAPAARAAELRIVITQAQAGDARKYQPLLEYLGAQGLPASFVTAPDNRVAADLFAAGKVDAMFSGSGIASAMFIKELAEPLVRAIGADGHATYSAVVIAPKGSPRFDGAASYFDGKRVIYAGLASAGEFYFHGVGASRPAARLKAASHGAALDALARGRADVAIVKNHVWASEGSKHPQLALVGADAGENPDNSLIVSRRLDAAVAQRLASALLALEADRSPAATRARQTLGVRGYVVASRQDFAHTLAMLKRAGVTKDFGFAF